MALFGEKYGEWVRVVEVDKVSRELCGGTHVANTAEVGIFKIVSEGSSAANVRRVEAITGPAAIDWFRERERQLREAGELLGNAQDPLAGARRAAEALREASASAERSQAAEIGSAADELARSGRELPTADGGSVLLIAAEAALANPKQLLDLANRIQSKAGGASAIVLGGADDGKVGLVALFSKAAVAHGLSAGATIREAAAVVGGGGGGRDDMAQAGGRDPEKLGEALETASAAVERQLA
jgi:alanyl-tRNA synthetase